MERFRPDPRTYTKQHQTHFVVSWDFVDRFESEFLRQHGGALSNWTGSSSVSLARSRSLLTLAPSRALKEQRIEQTVRRSRAGVRHHPGRGVVNDRISDRRGRR